MTRPAEGDSVQDHGPKDLRRRVVRGGSLSLVLRLTTQIVTWLATLVVVRWLTPSDYGLMVTAMLFANLADILATGGLGRALVQKKRVTRADQGAAFTLSLLLAAGIYPVLFALSEPVARYLETPDFTFLLRFMALTIFLVPLRVIGESNLERQLRFGKLSIVRVVAMLVQSGLLLALAIGGYGVWALAWSFFCFHVVQTLLICYLSQCRPSLRKPSADSVALMRYGLIVTASSLVWYIYTSSDDAVISALLGPASLGLYFIAGLIVLVPSEKISDVLDNILFAAFCRLQNNPQRMRSWFLRLFALRLLIACPVLAGIALVADDAVPLILGDKWQHAVLPLQLLAPLGVFMIVAHAFTPLFHAIGRPDLSLKFDCACAVALPIAFFIAAQFFGLPGVCLVWVILYPILITAMVQLTRTVTAITVADLIRSAAVVLMGTFFMGATVLVIRYFLLDAAPPSWRLAAMILAGFLSYSVWIFAFAREEVLAEMNVLWRELGWRRSTAPEAAGSTCPPPKMTPN